MISELLKTCVGAFFFLQKRGRLERKNKLQMTRLGAAAAGELRTEKPEAAPGLRPHYVSSRVGGPDPRRPCVQRARFRPTWPAQAQSPTAARVLGYPTAAGVTNWPATLPLRTRFLPSPENRRGAPSTPNRCGRESGGEPEPPRGSSRPLLAGTERERRLGDNGDVANQSAEGRDGWPFKHLPLAPPQPRRPGPPSACLSPFRPPSLFGPALLFPSEVAAGLSTVQLRLTSPPDFPFPSGPETGLSAPPALSG